MDHMKLTESEQKSNIQKIHLYFQSHTYTISIVQIGIYLILTLQRSISN